VRQVHRGKETSVPTTIDPVTMVSTQLDTMARRFPLIARNRPAARPLADRVVQVRTRADAAAEGGPDALLRAAEAHNLAALIVSDCGLGALAHELCWRQFTIFYTARPHTADAAKLALQPLVNLARLMIRNGDGDEAHRVLTTLFVAVKSRQSALIGETTVNFGDFFTTNEEHREVVAWIWSVLLSDGVRALTQSGRWAEALQHIQQHKGIGQRLFDGRQVAILAHHADGDLSGALDLLADTSTPTAWEEAVAACLRTLCLSAADCPTASATTAMVDRYLTLEPDPEVRVFRVRLGLCVIDLAQHVESAAEVHRVMQALESDARSAADAYVARDFWPTNHADLTSPVISSSR
jgi:hypothetical protein